jgi:uncharacterized tellurite resistance protein B-like protein
MIDLLRTFFDQKLSPVGTNDENQKIKMCQLAGAALMVELMQTDDQLDDRESAEFIRVLGETFQLDPADLDEIVVLAHEQASHATSLYEFTRLINDNYDYRDKVQLIDNLWRLAFADQRLDKYEESLIRRIADLIHVSHSDFIQTKLRVNR